VRTERDRAGFWAVLRDVLPEAIPHLDARHALWVATAPDLPGVVGAASAVLVDGGSAVFLAAAAVLPAARGRHGQAGAIRVRLAYARRLGARAALTYVAPWNVRSANALLGQGFRLYRPASPWAGAGRWLYLQRPVG
jgi:hypothetical protein